MTAHMEQAEDTDMGIGAAARHARAKARPKPPPRAVELARVLSETTMAVQLADSTRQVAAAITIGARQVAPLAAADATIVEQFRIAATALAHHNVTTTDAEVSAWIDAGLRGNARPPAANGHADAIDAPPEPQPIEEPTDAAPDERMAGPVHPELAKAATAVALADDSPAEFEKQIRRIGILRGAGETIPGADDYFERVAEAAQLIGYYGGMDGVQHVISAGLAGRRVHTSGSTAEPAPPSPSPDDYGAAPADAPIDGAPAYAGPPPLVMLDPTLWEGQEVPPRPWLIRDRIPGGKVTLLSGDGATGKTTIALQLAIATVRGTDWLGSAIDRGGPALFFSAEEDSDEVHRRLAKILDHQRLGFADLAGLHLHCRPGESAVLGTADRSGIVQPTELYRRLEKVAAQIAPTLIVIEAAADVFAGNENDRSQVRQFIALLQRIAGSTGAAMVLLAHPSLTGLASGSGTSGSTGWSNSVRSRLYFAKGRASDDDEGADNDVRELRVMKSNYGPAGEVVRLRWQAGLFVPVGTTAPLAQVAAEADAEAAYLAALDAATGQGRKVFPNKGRNYAPDTFRAMPQARGFTAKALAAAQERLFAAGRIHVVESGPRSRRVAAIERHTLDHQGGVN